MPARVGAVRKGGNIRAIHHGFDAPSVAQYKALLAKQNLLPGRRLLWQEMNQNFILLENSGMKTVAHLQKALATPGKLTAFSLRSGIPEDYLVLLRREIGSLVQKPIPLQHFPGWIPPESNN